MATIQIPEPLFKIDCWSVYGEAPEWYTTFIVTATFGGVEIMRKEFSDEDPKKQYAYDEAAAVDSVTCEIADKLRTLLGYDS